MSQDAKYREIIEEHRPTIDMMVGSFRLLEAGVENVVIRYAQLASCTGGVLPFRFGEE
jgi:hypothetical protein